MYSQSSWEVWLCTDRNCAFKSPKTLKFIHTVSASKGSEAEFSWQDLWQESFLLKEDLSEQSTYNFWFGGGYNQSFWCVWNWLYQLIGPIRWIDCFKEKVKQHLPKQNLLFYRQAIFLRSIKPGTAQGNRWDVIVVSRLPFCIPEIHDFKCLPKVLLKYLQKIRTFLNLEWECEKCALGVSCGAPSGLARQSCWLRTVEWFPDLPS